MGDIRVLRLISDLQVGGVQRMMLRTLRLLRGMGVESEVCCQKSEGPLAEKFREEGFPVHLIHFSSRLSPLALWKLRRFAIDGGFDIVHAHQYPSNIAANLAMLGCDRVRIVNSYHSFTPMRTRSQELQARWTSHLPHAIVAVSEAVRAPLLKVGIPSSRITIVYNGVAVPPDPAPLPAWKPGDPLRLVYAGRFVKQKRLDLLVDILKHCAERGIPFHATLLGDGPTRERIQAHVARYGLEGMIALPGVTHEVEDWLRRSDVYMTASEREGFSNALLECSAQARGFLASDIPPHREMLGGTEAGIVLDDRPDAWADAIGRLASDRSAVERLSRAAFERAREFSEENTAQKLLDIYRQILGK
jgi:glycosyltransferase involved in cell wall biosynthesis